MRRPIIAIFSVVVLFILFVVLCTFVRRPYEKVLLSRFGSLIPEEKQARICYNWYLKYPTDSVVRIDTRLHLYPGRLQQLNTAGSQSIAIQTYAAWKIVQPEVFFNATKGGSDIEAQKILDNKISGLVQKNIASHDVTEIFNTDPAKLKTPAIEDLITREATNGTAADGFHGMRDLGIEIVQVGFSRMAFPPSNAGKIYESMSQDQQTKALKFRAEGDAEAATIQAEGKAEAAKIRGEAVVAAEKIRGDADHDALAALASVQQSAAARDFYQYFKSLDFVKNSLSKNTYFILSSDAGWLKSLFTAPRNGLTQPETLPARPPRSPLPAPTPLEIPVPKP